ncbi:MAG: tetratricopeptide repeat protein [Opitutaceae bacterium]|nr:tetratricopeptide repeat protein [Opitutaceae bacterium]
MPTSSPSPADAPTPRLRTLAASISGWSNRRVIWTTAIAAAVVATFFFAPRFWLWVAVGVPLGELISVQPELNRAFFALQQLADPWQPIEDPTNRVIEWRLLFPLLGHYLHLPTWLYLALPHAGCLLALGAVAGIVRRATRDPAVTFGLTLLAATASWFFVASGWLAYFDSWLILGLLLASFSDRRWVIFAAALLTPWVDERFILALPLSFAVRALGAGTTPPDRRTLVADALALAAGLLPYVAVRLGAELTQTRTTSTSYWTDRPLVPAPLHATLWGVWSGLRLGWLAVILFVAACAGRTRWIAGAAVTGTLLVNLCVADDLSRSMSVALPAVLAGGLQLWRRDAGRLRQLLPWVCLGNLLLPAHHVIAAPGNEEEPYHFVPILGVFAEIAHRDDPPYFASPFAYNRRGLEAFQQGNRAKARAAFDLALRFDPDFARAQANRGLLRIASGEREAGMAELNAALARSPSLFEARLQRATLRRQLGDLRGALDDAREALRHMPADAPKRPDAISLERTLAQQLGL